MNKRIKDKKGISQEVIYLIIGAAIAIAVLVWYATTSSGFCKPNGLLEALGIC